MIRHKSFGVSTKKFPKIWSTVQKNKNDVDKQIDIDLKIRPHQILKKINNISVLKNVGCWSTGKFKIILPNWAVASIKPIAIFHILEDLPDISNLEINDLNMNFILENVQNNIYNFRFNCGASIEDSPHIVVDINIILYNPRIYQNLQKGLY